LGQDKHAVNKTNKYCSSCTHILKVEFMPPIPLGSYQPRFDSKLDYSSQSFLLVYFWCPAGNRLVSFNMFGSQADSLSRAKGYLFGPESKDYVYTINSVNIAVSIGGAIRCNLLLELLYQQKRRRCYYISSISYLCLAHWRSGSTTGTDYINKVCSAAHVSFTHL